MAGIALFVQVVAYPLFAHVPEDVLPKYEDAHANRTTRVVGPLMLVEGVTGLLLAIDPPAGIGPALPIVGIALLLAIWLSTFLVQVPTHAAISGGAGGSHVRALVARNWLRTVAWVARAGIVAAILARKR